jgi:hypothetical protein
VPTRVRQISLETHPGEVYLGKATFLKGESAATSLLFGYGSLILPYSSARLQDLPAQEEYENLSLDNFLSKY